MQKNRFNELQVQMLQSFIPQDMGPKAFIRFGRNMLLAYRKAKAYLREEPANKHWLAVLQLVLEHIDAISDALPAYLLELSPEEDQLMLGFYELITCCAQVAYEEAKLDGPAAIEKPILSEGQLLALTRLEELAIVNKPIMSEVLASAML